MKKINIYIFQADKDQENLIYLDYRSTLFDAISQSPQDRSRVLVHQSLDEKIQKMVIAFNQKSKIPFVYHKFSESFLCLEGAGRYSVMDKSDNIEDIVLGNYESGRYFMVVIPENTPHRFVPITNPVIAYELTHSHFDKEFTQEISGDDNSFNNLRTGSNENVLLTPIRPGQVREITKMKANTYALKSGIFKLNKSMIESANIKNGKIMIYDESDSRYEKEYIQIAEKGCTLTLESGTILVIDGEITIENQENNRIVGKDDLFVARGVTYSVICSRNSILHIIND